MIVTVVLVEGPEGLPGSGVTGGLAGIDVLGRAAGPSDAVRLVGDLSPDVLVVDLAGGAAALEAIAAVADAAPQVPVLTVGPAADHACALAAVRAGATSLLVAPSDATVLADAVRRTAAGEVVFSPGLADVVLEGFGGPADPSPGSRQLTDREADVLRLVVEGLTARQIATRLVLSPRTVENHVQHMLRKLGLSGRAALVRYAIENGLA